ALPVSASTNSRRTRWPVGRLIVRRAMRSEVEAAEKKPTGTVTSAIFRKPFQLALGGNVDLAKFPQRFWPPGLKPFNAPRSNFDPTRLPPAGGRRNFSGLALFIVAAASTRRRRVPG